MDNDAWLRRESGERGETRRDEGAKIDHRHESNTELAALLNWAAGPASGTPGL